jgi:predicted site-specific integrase-resolvase
METSIKQLDLVSSQEAAIILKVSPATLRVWRCTGRHKIPHYKAGKYVYYDKNDLLKFMSTCYFSYNNSVMS